MTDPEKQEIKMQEITSLDFIKNLYPDISTKNFNKIKKKTEDLSKQTILVIEETNPLSGWKMFYYERTNQYKGDNFVYKAGGVTENGDPYEYLIQPHEKEHNLNNSNPAETIKLLSLIIKNDKNKTKKDTKLEIQENKEASIDNKSKLFKDPIQFGPSNEIDVALDILRDDVAEKRIGGLDILDISQVGSQKNENFREIYFHLKKVFHVEKEKRANKIRKSVLKHINPEIINTSLDLKEGSYFIIRALNGDIWTKKNENIPRKTRIKNRGSILKAYPLFAKKLLRNTSILRKIDKGDAAKDIIRDIYRIKPERLNKLKGVKWQDVGRKYYHEPQEFLKDIKFMEDQHIPKDKNGWKDYFFTLKVAKEYRNSFLNPNHILANSYIEKFVQMDIENLNGNFQSIAQHQENYSPIKAREQKDFIRRNLLIPCLFNNIKKLYPSQPVGAIASSFEQINTLVEISDLAENTGLENSIINSKLWDKNSEPYMNEINDNNFSKEWTSLTKPATLPDGTIATEITSLIDLKKNFLNKDEVEINVMLDNILKGRSLFFSLTNNQDSISTIEIKPEKYFSDNINFLIVKNDPEFDNFLDKPLTKTEKNLRDTLDGLPLTTYYDYKDELKNTPHKNQEMVPKSDFDVQKSWEKLSQYLPKSTQKAGLQGFTTKLTQIITENTKIKPKTLNKNNSIEK